MKVFTAWLAVMAANTLIYLIPPAWSPSKILAGHVAMTVLFVAVYFLTKRHHEKT